MATERRTFDYIVVGAGSAGCVVANRLSADPRNRVCVVEAGTSDRKPSTWFKVNLPSGTPFLLFDPRYNWMHSFKGSEWLFNATIPCPRGHIFGGSSSVNGMVYIRGQKQDYDAWAALGNTGWSYDEVLPYFKKQENREAGANAYHGAGGELNVARLRHLNPLTEAFTKAAVETQYPRNDDFNGPQQDGFGACEVTQKNGERWSSARAFLHPAMKRPNLEVISEALVTKIRFDGRRALGLTIERGGETLELDARAEVIVSSGAVNSPQLLLLSGIGPAAELQRHGIAVVADLPGVGQNLQDHPIVSMMYEDPAKASYAMNPRTWPQMAFGALQWLVSRQGMMTSNGVEGIGFVRSRPDLETPNIQYVFRPALAAAGANIMAAEYGFVIYPTLLREKSRGHLELASPNPADKPVMHPNFLAEPEDLDAMVSGMRIARQVIAAPSFAKHRGKELTPGDEMTSDAALKEYARKTVGTCFHPAGTCKMGPDADPMAVVDPTLKVRGIEGLRVIDTSIMPLLVSGNTNAPTMMIGERGAEFILKAAQTAPAYGKAA
jgi:choline dehydrogenase-like flavoprotein